MQPAAASVIGNASVVKQKLQNKFALETTDSGELRCDRLTHCPFSFPCVSLDSSLGYMFCMSSMVAVRIHVTNVEGIQDQKGEIRSNQACVQGVRGEGAVEAGEEAGGGGVDMKRRMTLG